MECAASLKRNLDSESEGGLDNSLSAAKKKKCAYS